VNNLFQELDAGHFGHSLVGNNQLDGMLLKNFKACSAAACRVHVVVPPESRFKGHQVLFFVVNVENIEFFRFHLGSNSVAAYKNERVVCAPKVKRCRNRKKFRLPIAFAGGNLGLIT
jgi:hypothetical protein